MANNVISYKKSKETLKNPLYFLQHRATVTWTSATAAELNWD